MTRQRLCELPEIFGALAVKPHGGPGIGRVTGSVERPQPMSDERRWARSTIKATLAYWARVIEFQRKIPVPRDEDVIALAYRQAVTCEARAQDELKMVSWIMRGQRELTGDRRDIKVIRESARRHRMAATTIREQRELGVDVVDALREYIERHLLWLLAGENAEQFAHDINEAYVGRKLAYRVPGSLRIRCSCGAWLSVATDDQKVMTCPGCAASGTIAWWRDREAPHADRLLRLRELPDWLLTHHGLKVTLAQVHLWSSRGILRPVERRSALGRIPYFDPATVAAVAHERLARRGAAGQRRGKLTDRDHA